ncbi:helix-turn-helix transcriptional regulator [bacterium]|nr:helix-turn-helix transcriptional regulator [bacterium]
MEYYAELESEDKELKAIGLELMFLTPEKYQAEDGITAVELAKLVNIPLETVKKKLTILKDKGLARVKGINPKYWTFDQYNFQRLPEDDETFLLLCSFDDVDFDKYFSY